MWNHLLSNIGYMVLGVLFNIVVYMKPKPEYKSGVDNDHRIFHAMGLALFMIGVMSSCYHLCPTSVNFQFDTTYMYVLAILMCLKLFKNRHPDLTPDAISAFAMLAFSVLIGVGDC